jgi:hypothetical protein
VAATLKQVLLAPERRKAVVADLQTLVDREVAGKSGMSGLAIKGSFAVVKKVRAGFVPQAINAMLPEFAHRLQPYYDKYDPATDGSLPDFLAANQSAVADVMLAVADGRARRSRHETAKRAYQKLRPQAKKHVISALPQLGALIEKYARAAEDEQTAAAAAEATGAAETVETTEGSQVPDAAAATPAAEHYDMPPPAESQSPEADDQPAEVTPPS